MEHKQLNRIIAGIVFIIACIVYGKTIAPTTSYWDCGEFITASYILGVPHPPGAPLYILVGRVFTMLPFFEDIGLRVNIISLLVSAFSIMFAYLIIVRLIKAWKGIPETIEQKITIYTGGIIGALGLAFSDSVWFNAVEAEVYAVSMFFTAAVFWLILVWLEKADEPVNEKILLFIAYLIGLATGVHLLNILAIPALFLIIYFKKAAVNWKTFSIWSLAAAAAFGAVYPGIVKGVPWLINEFSFTALGAVVLALFFAIFYAIKNHKHTVSLVLMAVMLVFVGYSTYAAIFIRSGQLPAINENHPDTTAKLVKYLNRDQYGDIPLTTRRAPVLEYQIKKMYVRYFGWQFIGKGNTLGPDNYIVETITTRGLMMLPFLVGLLGMYHHFRKDWQKASAVLALFILTGIAITIYLNQEDPQPRERDYVYVGSFFAFAIWIGIGASALLEIVLNAIRQSSSLRKIALGLTIVLLIVAVPINLFRFNYHSHDRTGNYVAFDYSYNILQSCEKDGIIFTNGDNDTFPLWFLQYVNGIRKDVRVVNLSLLNTDWYIKQLRDEEPKVPIKYTDAEIDNLVAIPWPEPKKLKVKVPRKKVIEYLENSKDNSELTPEEIADFPVMEFEMTNTRNITGYPVILVQDRMMLHIIASNAFKRPIYVAVTVAPKNMLGLDNRKNTAGLKSYLRMDGLAFKIMPYGGPIDFLSYDKLQTNLFEKFQYRSLNDPDVYLNDNVQGLLQNYRSAFLRLSNYYQTQKDPAGKEKSLAVLDKMFEVMPEEVIPFRNYRLSLNFGRMYADAGRPEELEKRLEQISSNYNLSSMDKLYLAEYYAQYLRNDVKAESLATDILAEDPDNLQTYGWLIRFYNRKQKFDKSVEILQKYLQGNPGDQSAKKQLADLQTLISQKDSLNTNHVDEADEQK